MSTLAAMKSRIADELGDRSDLDGQIANAVTTAIAAYQSERFIFNESRDVTFATVPGQEFYTGIDNAALPDLMGIDYITLTTGAMVTALTRLTPAEVEILSQNGTQMGEPYAFTVFERKLRLYPVPTSVHQVRIATHRNIAVPASDDEPDNPWMTDAELLIRARAKYELALHVLMDGVMAEAMSPDPAAPGMPGHAAYREFIRLKGRANNILGTGTVRPMQF